VFVRDLDTDTITLVSRAGGADGAKGNGDSLDAAISDDGRFVAFDSYASNLSPDDGDGVPDIFVRDRQAATTTVVSRAGGAGGSKSNSYSCHDPSERFLRPYGLRSRPACGVEEAGSPTTVVGDVQAAR